MRYENDVAEADIIADSKVQFATPQYRSETLMADAMLKYKQLGFPIQWVAEQMGQSSDEVQRIMRMRADEMADPELESLNRALQIGGADGGRIAGAGLQPETAGDVGAGGGQAARRTWNRVDANNIQASWKSISRDFLTLFSTIQTKSAETAIDASA